MKQHFPSENAEQETATIQTQSFHEHDKHAEDSKHQGVLHKSPKDQPMIATS